MPVRTEVGEVPRPGRNRRIPRCLVAVAAQQATHRGIPGNHQRGTRDLAAADPCHYIAFDPLRLQGRDLTGEPLTTRRVELEKPLADVPSSCPVTLDLHTADVHLARTWMDGLAAVGVEGLVVKAAGGRYSPGAAAGRRSSTTPPPRSSSTGYGLTGLPRQEIGSPQALVGWTRA